MIPYLAHLGLLVFWEVLVYMVYDEQWPGEEVTVSDALEPRCFGGKPCSRMEVSNCACQDWELVKIVDSFPCCIVGIESLDVSKN